MVMGEGDSQAFMGTGNDVYVQCASWGGRGRVCLVFVVSSAVVRMEYCQWWYSSVTVLCSGMAGWAW